MTLDTVFSKSFGDYKKNFKITVLATLLFRLLPILIIAPLLFMLFTIPFINLSADFVESSSQIVSNFNLTNTNEASLMSLTGNAVAEGGQASLQVLGYIKQAFSLFLRAIPFHILLWILGLIASVIIFYAAFNNKKGNLRFGEALRKSMHYFWKFLLFNLLIFFIFILISIGFVAFMLLVSILSMGFAFSLVLVPLLVIGFFVLFVYLVVIWGFAVYFIFDEDCGIFESLSKSKQFVKGRFWRVLGYILLMFLILIGVSLIFWVIGFLVTLPFGTGMYASEFIITSDFNKAQYIDLMVMQSLGNTISNYLITILASLTTAPFMIFFFKNLYQELKEERKSKRKVAAKVI